MKRIISGIAALLVSITALADKPVHQETRLLVTLEWAPQKADAFRVYYRPIDGEDFSVVQVAGNEATVEIPTSPAHVFCVSAVVGKLESLPSQTVTNDVPPSPPTITIRSVEMVVEQRIRVK